MTDKELFWKLVDITNGSLTSDKAENEAVKLINDYASTKAEEVAIEFYGYMVSAPDEDINDKTIYEVFDEWFTQYKQQ